MLSFVEEKIVRDRAKSSCGARTQLRRAALAGEPPRAYDASTMLPEQRATSYAHDPALGTVLVHCADETRPNLHGDVAARLLLDGASHLVGIDIAPDTPDRLVVMLGAHESVARVEAATVHVESGGRRITLHGSAAKMVAPGASPYVP